MSIKERKIGLANFLMLKKLELNSIKGIAIGTKISDKVIAKEVFLNKT
jgi:hypothetical protein